MVIVMVLVAVWLPILIVSTVYGIFDSKRELY